MITMSYRERYQALLPRQLNNHRQCPDILGFLETLDACSFRYSSRYHWPWNQFLTLSLGWPVATDDGYVG